MDFQNVYTSVRKAYENPNIKLSNMYKKLSKYYPILSNIIPPKKVENLK